MRHLLSAISITLLLGASVTACGQEADVSAQTFEDGMAAYEREDYSTALSIFQPLADQGNASAQFNLGEMYHNGRGVQADFFEAFRWYRLAAEQGHMEAQFQVGLGYVSGTSGQRDHVEARRWLGMVAEQGHERAEILLQALPP